MAALGHVLSNNEVPEALQLHRLDADTRYLDSISDSWVQFEPVERTATGVKETISLELVESGQDRVTKLSLPDMGGEKFRQQLSDRQWDADYGVLAKDATGILLMVDCKEINDSKTINQVEATMVSLDSDDGESDDEEDVSGDYIPWDVSKMPTAVQLVELLQFILDAQNRQELLRVSVVISAWDIVEKMNENFRYAPSPWLERRLPLLAQFLRANGEDIEAKIFGISAQGGSYEEDLEKLQNVARSAARVRVYEGDETEATNDITRPIRWLMGGPSS